MDYKKPISDFFAQRCAAHGDYGWQAACYESDANQYGTFVKLMRLVGKQSGTLLDVGCGQGDLFEFIDSRGVDVIYNGIDLCPAMVGYAKARFPEGRFEAADVLEYTHPHDFVVAAGVMNFNFPDHWQYTHQVIAKMWELARKGLALNLLSDAYRDYERRPDLCYFDPADVLRYCLTLTTALFLDRHCSGYDFCIYMHKK